MRSKTVIFNFFLKNLVAQLDRALDFGSSGWGSTPFEVTNLFSMEEQTIAEKYELVLQII